MRYTERQDKEANWVLTKDGVKAIIDGKFRNHWTIFRTLLHGETVDEKAFKQCGQMEISINKGSVRCIYRVDGVVLAKYKSPFNLDVQTLVLEWPCVWRLGGE